jgi:hypothetical protein
MASASAAFASASAFAAASAAAFSTLAAYCPPHPARTVRKIVAAATAAIALRSFIP